MNTRPTPETDSEIELVNPISDDPYISAWVEKGGAVIDVVDADFARRLERERDEARELAIYEHAGTTASAMGWAIKYANLRELVVRLIQAKGRHHTRIAFDDLKNDLNPDQKQP